MRSDEIAIAADWAAAEGWNPGLTNAACFATVDPEGFLIGEIDGAPASTVSQRQLRCAVCLPWCGAMFGVSLLGRVKPADRGRVSPVFQLVQPRAPRPPVEYLSNMPCPSKVRVAARRFGPMSVPNYGLTAIPPGIIIVQRLAAGVPPKRHLSATRIRPPPA